MLVSGKERKASRPWAIIASIALLSLGAPLGAADVYKVVDEQGRVTYTDTPPPGSQAEKVEIRDSNRLPPTPAQPAQTELGQQAEEVEYRVTITSPPQDFHVTPGIRDLNVEINVEPRLQAGHRLELTDNGEIVPGRTLQNIVVRGTHVLLARVVDREGAVVAESEPVNIHVHRPSIGGRR